MKKYKVFSGVGRVERDAGGRWVTAGFFVPNGARGVACRVGLSLPEIIKSVDVWGLEQLRARGGLVLLCFLLILVSKNKVGEL